MAEIDIEYDEMTPEELLKALQTIAHEEGLEEELKKSGSEHNIWDEDNNKNLAKLENWVTEKLLDPLEAYRLFWWQSLGLNPEKHKEIWQQFTHNPKPAKELKFDDIVSSLMGITPFFLANLEIQGIKEIDVYKLPTSLEGKIKLPKIGVGIATERIIELTEEEKEAAKWAEKAAALKITQWADTIRDEIRWTVAESIRKKLQPWQLQQILWDKFKQYATDLRRVAITELHDSYITGKIMSWPEGTIVEGVSAPGACSFCKTHINGKRFKIVHTPPANPTEEDYKTLMWPGKTNFGRKRADWIPTVPSHVNCRCVLVEVPENDNNRKEKEV
jgi:hypothetical protein